MNRGYVGLVEVDLCMHDRVDICNDVLNTISV